MNTALRWQRLQDLFHAACELPVEQREDFIARAASDDPQLLDELRSMLQIEASATARLHESAKATQDVIGAAQVLPEGTRFGPWALLHPIGRGGMGQVYLARRADGAYERQVALKLTHSVSVTPRQQAFFEVERQLLAQMHHPAIAQIHDAGTDAHGRLWLVMEYVEGERITDFCNDHALSVRQRIDLFLRLCDGVQHAHQKGVVHRDIKPGNVLVREIDGVPMPCLIDFGIASDRFKTSEPAGTPGYMSPEQAASEQRFDSRSDIYSLGALLGELLGGDRPDPATGSEPLSLPSQRLATLKVEQLDRRARERGLPPQRLLRLLREDLDWIVDKAMQADPEQRYQSISLLAADLRRFLDGYPVSAAPMRRTLAARKFMTRHRIGVSAAALVLISLVAGLAGTLWALHKAEIEAHRKQITADFLGSVLASVDPDVAGELDKTLLLHVLDDASRRVETELADDPEGRVGVQFTIAESYTSLGMPHKAIPLLESARDLARSSNAVGSNADLLAAQRLGTALVDAGKYQESETVLRDAIAAASIPGRELPPSLLPDLRSRLGWTLRQRGKMEEALDQAQSAYQDLAARMPENHPQLLDAGGRFAILLSDTGRYDEAIALMREMISRRTEDLGIDHPRVLGMRLSLAVFYLQKRDFAAGERELKAMLGPMAQLYGTESSMVAMVHGNLGGALRQQNKIEEAGPHYRFAYDFNLKHDGPEAPNTIMTRHNLANWMLDAGEAKEANIEQLACLKLAERVFGAEHDVTAEILRGLGLSQIALGQLAEARTSLERSLAIKTALYGDTDGPLAQVREAIGQLEAAEHMPSGDQIPRAKISASPM